MKKIDDILKKRLLFLDGATGTELQKRGMTKAGSLEEWALKNPRILSELHLSYQNAGSDVIYTCTFGANRLKLKQYRIADVYGINRKLAQLARNCLGSRSIIAGDIGPTGTFIEPFGPLKFEEAVKIFKEQARGLLSGGVDIFVIETMMDIQEARAALIAVKEISDKFTIVTMTFEANGRTLNGTDPLTALITLQSLGADAFGCNCSSGPQDMLKIIETIKPYAKVPLVAKPNAGVPKFVKSETLFTMKEKEFAKFGRELALKGTNIIGGCCGSTPAHIKELTNQLKAIKPILPVRQSISALSSSHKHLFIEKDKTLLLIGECLNPTGRKDLAQQLRQEKTNLIYSLAKEQQVQGADLLDVNIGLSGIDEVKTFPKIINFLSSNTDIPLAIDSSKPEAIEAALRVYPGRALINSISGEKKKTKKLLKIAAKYGAMFIILPLDEKGMPKDLRERITIIRSIFQEAQNFAFTKDDIIVDAMAMAISSNPNSAQDTLETISWLKNIFNSHSVIGLSNISFGLPRRSWINAAYLAMAQSKGLTTVIANPLNKELRNIRQAADLLLQKDKDAARFLNYSLKALEKKRSSLSLKEKIFNAVLEGNRQEIKLFIKEALKKDLSAEDIIQKIMVPAINKVGDLFDKKKYFLPQLIASAETMKLAFQYLKPYFKKDQIPGSKKTVVILATVKGDIHDIGKNIVSLILQNHGFPVIDLGKDVSSERIIREIKRHQSPIVGLSALMTTTMVNMKEIVGMAKAQKLYCRFIVGGAVVSKSYAHSLGASYARDGVDAVRVVKRISTAG
ncbi:MAG: homocysteine S-methyltransferase family protein [Candidatus Omnitrophica bacterium]|jgi:5-methyltetrahydrofolate--homocysteine methyltransferase|nr:homocysteine S-methyltransferase family protein [Candidatus Omnitrophota bacterium]